VPRRYPELNLPQRVVDWTDDHYLRYLTQRGADSVSDLILGDEAFNRYLAELRRPAAIPGEERGTRYPQLAAETMEGGLPGSSAHGEHPKFAMQLREGDVRRSVIVKFSSMLASAVGRRWGDLLIAEHHAHELLSGAGLPACRSRIFEFADRIFLEVDRFDRDGREGRVGVVSLWAIDTARYGQLDTWIDSATRLQRDGLIDAATLEQVRFAAIFGALIANTDRHFGNLAFYDRYDGQFQLAPIYDMLPMLFAPDHDQILARVFEPPDPLSDTVRAYGRARELAERYWRSLTQDARISAEFRAICAACLATLEALPRTGAFASTQA
jgi:serine/threonine protein kinase HipA of HipAB toxin-antitoxin module